MVGIASGVSGQTFFAIIDAAAWVGKVSGLAARNAIGRSGKALRLAFVRRSPPFAGIRPVRELA